MGVSSVSYGGGSVGGYQPLSAGAAPPQKTAGLDSDGDFDNDTTESAAAKASEAGAKPSLPTDPNRGRNLNISV